MNARAASHAAALILLPLCVASAAALAADPDSIRTPLAVTLGPGSELRLEGTSTLHDFESRTHDVRITLGRDSSLGQPADLAGLEALVRSSGVRGVDVQVPVRSLRSEKAGLDKNLWRAMRAEEYPTVRFRLSRYALAPRAASGDTLDVRAEGRLEITGHERPVALDARFHSTPGGLALEGSYSLLMSDYGIRPPRMMLGTLRVGDRITIHYRVLLLPGGTGGGPLPDSIRSERSR